MNIMILRHVRFAGWRVMILTVIIQLVVFPQLTIGELEETLTEANILSNAYGTVAERVVSGLLESDQ
jgi:hypothetical protein